MSGIDYLYGKLKYRKLNKLKILFVSKISNNFLLSLNKNLIKNLKIEEVKYINKLNIYKGIKNCLISGVGVEKLTLNNINYLKFENFDIEVNSLKSYNFNSINTLLLDIGLNPFNFLDKKIFLKNIKFLKIKHFVYEINDLMKFLDYLKKFSNINSNKLKLILNTNNFINHNNRVKKIFNEIKTSINKQNKWDNKDIENIEKKLSKYIIEELVTLKKEEQNLYIPEFIRKSKKVHIRTFLI